MKKGIIYIIFATLLFSSMEIALKVIATQFHPVQLTFIRFFIGSMILLPFALKKMKVRNISLKSKDYKFFIMTGFICIVVSMIFFQLSVIYSTASMAAILFSTNPIFIVPLSYFLLKEKTSIQVILAFLISILGMLIILNPFALSTSALGIGFSLIAAITFALYSVLLKSKTNQYGAILLTTFSFIMGTAQLLVLILLSNCKMISNWLVKIGLSSFSNIPILKGIVLDNLPNLIYVGVFVTGLGYMFYFLSMEETSVTTASLVFLIKPALAPILATVILNEKITIPVGIGILFIVTGSVIAFLSNNKKQSISILVEDISFQNQE